MRRFLLLTFVTSKAASSAAEELKSFREGLTVKVDSNPGHCQALLIAVRCRDVQVCDSSSTKKLICKIFIRVADIYLIWRVST